MAIAQMSGEQARAGWIALLTLMAVISLHLGILDLLPVPMLDGGHILIMTLEGVARRDFSLHVQERMHLAGLMVLLMLMVTVIYNDPDAHHVDRAPDPVAALTGHGLCGPSGQPRVTGRPGGPGPCRPVAGRLEAWSTTAAGPAR